MSNLNAKYSAAVNAMRGVRILSMAGSSAKLTNMVTCSKAPCLSKSSLKNRASSAVMPMAAKTVENGSPVPRDSCLSGRPAPQLCCVEGLRRKIEVVFGL